MPSANGASSPVSVRTIRLPSQPVSTTARAAASRCDPSAFMTNRYGWKPDTPGLPGGLPTGAGVTSGSSSMVATCLPSGAISAITAIPPRGRLPPTWRPSASSTCANVARTTAIRDPSADADGQP